MNTKIKILLTVILTFITLTSSAKTAHKVEIHFDIPEGVEKYSGRQPVTFGVPFRKDLLKVGTGLRVVNRRGREVPAQFEAAAHWSLKKQYIKWLIVDCFAVIKNGKAEKAYLEFGTDVKSKKQQKLSVKKNGNDSFLINNGNKKFVINKDENSIGTFYLRHNNGQSFATTRSKLYQNYYDIYEGDSQKITLEKNGSVRAVIKQEGWYEKVEGKYKSVPGRRRAEYINRFRFYKDLPFVRVYHTMIWQDDARIKIAALDFKHNTAEPTLVTAGLDNKAISPDAKNNLLLRQAAYKKAEGTAAGIGIDGWLNFKNKKENIFTGLRWAREMFPTAFKADKSSAFISLIGPEKPLGLSHLDMAVDAVKGNIKIWDTAIYHGGLSMQDVSYWAEECIPFYSPRGVARTWEMLIWYGDDKIDSKIKNIFVQHPVYAYADPEFAVEAELPNPATAFNKKKFPEVEDAIERAFDWYTREYEEDGDFGIWNYGGLQWVFTPNGFPIYRYWMGNGKGWSTLPFALWIRSGNRKYMENAEAHSRYQMDVTICHVRDKYWSKIDGKFRGGQYSYCSYQLGRGPRIFGIFNGSEFLPYSYYMTGFERAKDVMLIHAEAMAEYKYKDPYMDFFRKDRQKNVSRHTYMGIKNNLILYEATWDKRLLDFAEKCFQVTLETQQKSGNIPNVRSNNYISQGMNIAERLFGWKKVKGFLTKWHNYLGDPIRPGTTGATSGPMSLWTAVNMYKHTGDKHYLDIAAKVMNTEAAAVMRSENPDWNGFNDITAIDAGPAIRDWCVTMAALDREPVQNKNYIPMWVIYSGIKSSEVDAKAGWGMKNIALTLNETGKDFTVAFHYSHPPERVINIYSPSGKLLVTEKGAAVKAYNGMTAFSFKIKVPGKEKGVYTIEMLSRVRRNDRATRVNVTSSTGKIVCYMPEEKKYFIATSSKSGQIWFKPIDGEEISIGKINNKEIIARTILLDQNQKIVAANTADKTIAPKNKHKRYHNPRQPKGKIVKYKKDKYNGLYSAVFTTSGPFRFRTIKGIEPYVSNRKEVWFDPRKYKMMDVKKLIK
ncbi:MAG: exo-rhamnogalacturonan lyase family protein [Planctomycetota bacterium]|jgi:hypothetical protein